MTQRRSYVLVFILALFLIVGCNKEKGCTDPDATNYDPQAEKDDNSCKYSSEDSTSVPENYDFENFDRSAQLDRIVLLDLLQMKIEEAESGATVTEQELLNIYLNNGLVGNGSVNIEEVVRDQDTAYIKGLFGEVALHSGDPNQVIGGKFVNADSVELKQVVRYGIMGAAFYYQATDRLLEDLSQYDNSNVISGKGTEQAHRFDMAFGYFGVPTDFSLSTPTEQGNDHSEEAWFWGRSCQERDPAIGILEPTFNAFVKGRTAILNNNTSTRDVAAANVEDYWEELIAADLTHHLKACVEDKNNGDMHSLIRNWSMAYGAYYCLRFNTDGIISASERQQIGIRIGSSPNDPSVADLNDALATIQGVYGFSNTEFQAL